MIRVLDYHVDARTGHISVEVQSETTDGKAKWTGPKRTYGVDALAFRNRFNSDPQQLEAWIASEHKANEGADVELTDHLLKRKGRVIG